MGLNIVHRCPVNGIKTFYIKYAAFYFQKLYEGYPYTVRKVRTSACKNSLYFFITAATVDELISFRFAEIKYYIKFFKIFNPIKPFCQFFFRKILETFW